MSRLALALLLLAALPASAAVSQAALTTRAHWPLSIADDAGFDTASRAEILVFTSQLDALDAADLAALTKVKSVDQASVDRWKAQAKRLSVVNFAKAATTCAKDGLFCGEAPRDWAGLKALATAALAKTPGNLGDWREEMSGFWRLYLIEQLRLAALFPKTTSEILPLEDGEKFGTDDADKSFLLTFDDGPTPTGGTTDAVTAMLREHHVNGTFFLLGNALESREKTADVAAIKLLYAGMCVGSHGMEHKSHASWAGAADGLAALPEGQAALTEFRPPYGQRNAAILQILHDSKMIDVLWNIDSQDWQHPVTPELAAGRVTSLMLLWRRGIILFHDIHPKAQGALPAIWKATEGAHVTWRDCRAE
jgi:peptidoglycan/xylan/chitin deacetylase (PgdA/CDA1 family)